jgi:hypothetical protein
MAMARSRSPCTTMRVATTVRGHLPQATSIQTAKTDFIDWHFKNGVRTRVFAILLGNRNGTFQPETAVNLLDNIEDFGIVAGDFNSDGLDFVMPNVGIQVYTQTEMMPAPTPEDGSGALIRLLSTQLLLLQAEALVHQSLQARFIQDVVGELFVGKHRQRGALGARHQLGSFFNREVRVLTDHGHYHADHNLQTADIACLLLSFAPICRLSTTFQTTHEAPKLLSVPLDVPRHERVAPFEVIVAAKRPERNGYIGVDLQSLHSNEAPRSSAVSRIDEIAPAITWVELKSVSRALQDTCA